MRAQNLSQIGFYSFCGLFLLLFLICYTFGANYFVIAADLISFWSGDFAKSVPPQGESLGQSIVYITGLVLISTAVEIVILFLVSAAIGRSQTFAIDSIDRMLDRGPLPLFGSVFIEELLARLLFLGFIAAIFTGALAWYILAIMANSVWAYIHIYNYREQRDQSFLRVIPQFIAGLTYAYIFARYGFFTVVMAHYLGDVLILSTRKEQVPNSKDGLLLAYYALVGLIFSLIGYFRGVNLLDFGNWINGDGSLNPIPGYGFWDYLVGYGIVSSFCSVMGYVLLLDRKLVARQNHWIIVYILGSVISVVVVLFLSYLLSFIIESPLVIALVICMGLSLMIQTTSGSTLARVWIVYTPSGSLLIMCFLVLGFWMSLGFLLIFYAINFLAIIISSEQELVGATR